MTISTYNLQKFIDQALQDRQARSDPNWNEWATMVSRVYNHRLPDSVLILLESSNIQELKDFASAEMSKNSLRFERKYRIELRKSEKYSQWVQRRDAGNARVQLEEQKKRQLRAEEDHEKARIANERYVKDMLPKWKENLDEYTERRESEMTNIWRTRE